MASYELRKIKMEISGTDPYLFSPRAPSCSIIWRELLGLKKFSQSTNQPSKSQSQSNKPKSLKHLLHRSSKSSSSLSLPLLKKDSDICESVSVSSSRLSLSSSSSCHEHEDLPRLSLDSHKLSMNNSSPNPFAPSRMRMVKPIRPGSRRDSSSRGSVLVDSPRINSCGKIVFQSLETSSTSPSSNFNGGPKRSYSANVRITPVLNVPVCSLKGSSKSANGGSSKGHHQSNISIRLKP